MYSTMAPEDYPTLLESMHSRRFQNVYGQVRNYNDLSCIGLSDVDR